MIREGMMVREISGIRATLEEGEKGLRERVASILRVPAESLAAMAVVRRAIDARRSKPPMWIFSVRVELSAAVEWMVIDDKRLLPAGMSIRAVTAADDSPVLAGRKKRAPRPVIVGCGPAGLFAALTLARSGVPVLLLERGKALPDRLRDIERFWKEGVFTGESHVHFGEGGAGTFSDGKLTTRIRNPYLPWVKEVLVEMGAPAEILTAGKPHIGTDRLRGVLIRFRESLLNLGCVIRFETSVTDFLIRRHRLAGLVLGSGEEIPARCVVLAPGQSADDTYHRLWERGVTLAPKAFAMGVRVEHPQELIDCIQYGKWRVHPELPPAEYLLTAAVPGTGRAAYSFCMCPGGQVIACSAREKTVVTNGMSVCRRDGSFADSAIVVPVRTEDFPDPSPLGGLAFRRLWEERAFALGEHPYHAPAQRLTDFLAGRPGGALGSVSYRPGVTAASLRDCLPGFVTETLKRAFPLFERRMRGFVTEAAHLIGVETRTSSPLRILRDQDGQSVSVRGLYPCGEGAGYAGGIMSSALDGIRAARKILEEIQA